MLSPGREAVAAARRIVATYAGGASDILIDDFYNSLHAVYSAEEVKTQIQRCGIAGLSLSLPTDRHSLGRSAAHGLMAFRDPRSRDAAPTDIDSACCSALAGRFKLRAWRLDAHSRCREALAAGDITCPCRQPV
jgi:hypothetical protein